MKKKIKNVQMFSMGGSGSYWIYSALKARLKTAPELQDIIYDIEGQIGGGPYKHRKEPPEALHCSEGVALYLYCTPLHHALCMYNKKLSTLHCQQMGGEVPGIRKVKTFEDFVENGVDYFEYHNHLSNWLNHKTKYPRILIKYENIGEEFDRLCHLIKMKPGETLTVKQRKANHTKLSTNIRDKLLKMFKTELELYNSLDSFIVRER